MNNCSCSLIFYVSFDFLQISLYSDNGNYYSESEGWKEAYWKLKVFENSKTNLRHILISHCQHTLLITTQE